MAKSHAVGWASDSPTPAQLKEFFAQIESGKITKNSLQTLLRSKEVQETAPLTESEQLAANILGRNKVAGYLATCKAWNIEPDENIPEVPFSEKILRNCARTNKFFSDWRVVYIHGFSFNQQLQRLGCDCKIQPCFDPDYRLLLSSHNNSWANMPTKAGYRLFDFAGRFDSMPWQTQEAMILKLGAGTQRAEEQEVTEACFTFYQISNKNEYLLKNFWHMGCHRTSSGDHIAVGRFDKDGMNVDDCNDSLFNKYLGVVVSFTP